MGDDEWEKLPTEDKVVHKVWKARVAGYEEAKKRFEMVDNEKTKECTSYLGLLKKFVTDNNAVAQEKGLLATLAFVENIAESSRVCSDVVSGIVTKVLNGKPKLKQLGMDICLMYIENEKQDVVMEELINGFANKQPKIVAACAALVNQAIREFGGKVITMKPVVKSLQKLLEHSDKNVREEAKALAIELYKWIRDAIRPQLANIKPVQLKELEDEWSQVDAGKPNPTRFTKSEQAKRAIAPPPSEATEVTDEGGGDVEEEDEVDEAVDPYDLMDAVDIIPLMPKNFYEQIAHTKWSERKEALENLDKLTSKPKIEAGHFGELMGCLKKVISKDSNVVVVALAAKCVQGLARGLRSKFNPYAPMITSAILEKFKEKKMNVVLALRDSIDAVFSTTTLSNMSEDVLAALESKNPNVKEETCKFLTRAISHLNQATLPKPLLKQLAAALIKRMDGTVAAVRDGAAEALGMAMKVIGEKAMMPYVDQLDKIKAEKVKECYEKAEPANSAGKPTKASKPAPSSRPVTAPAKSSSSTSAAAAPSQSTQKAPPKRPGTANPKKKAKAQSGSQAAGKKAGKPSSGGAKKAKKGAAAFAEDEAEPTEPELSEGAVEDIAVELFGEAMCKQLGSANWKERLEAVEEITKKVNGMSPDSKTAQAIVRTLAKKPGFKDNNMMALKGKFALLGIVAKQSRPFSRRTAIYAITGLIEKIGDLKLKDAVKETLKIFAENISLNYVSLKVAKVSNEVKNPKTQAEALVWMSEALKEFGFKIDTKPHIAFIKTSLQNTNPAIRSAAVQFLATMYLYIGASLRTLFEDEKPALLQQIDAEFDKVKGEKPPAPTRKIVGDEDDEADKEDEGGDSENEEADAGGGGVNPDDLVDRKNISDKFTEGLIAKLSDKNWKIRNEGLQEVVDILKENKFILPDLGELPVSLKARLGDSNKNMVIISLGICKTLAEGIGPIVARHKSTLLPNMLSTMADAKPQLQTAAKEALSAWQSKIGFKEFVTDEVLSTALKIPKPNLRIGLLSWMEQILPEEKRKLPVEFNESIAPLLGCLEDRNADVRKNAQAVLPLMMAHTGYEAMAKAANKLEATSKNAVMAIIDKARETCVMIQNVKKGKPTKSGKSGASSTAISAPSVADIDLKDIKSTEEPKKKPTDSKKATKKPAAAAPSKKRKEEEDDGPAVIYKIGKDQRMKDEKSLKTLKWNFTTPRDEMVQQLKDQMMPCFSASMVKKLFHDDFKFHIEAIALLSQAVSSNRPAMIESLDIILRWFSLRFFDTNTTVLLKSLEFLESFFDMLSEESYNLSEYEGSAFVPYLVLKIGDPKDNVRKSVHNLFKKLTHIYPATKLFTYFLEGLASKNSKTRMECLTELGFLISKFGMDVCQPTPPKALKEMATQIGDRDNGVRSAALNAIVDAYNIVGEQVYKMIGRLSDKDRSYLEERIKRAGKTKPAPAAEPKKPAADAKPAKNTKKSSSSSEPKEQVDSEVVVVSKMKPRGSSASSEPAASAGDQPSKVKREFHINYDDIGKDVLQGTMPKLNQVDFQDQDFEVAKPVNVSGKTSMTTAARDISAWLDLTIAQIANSDINVSLEALAQFEEVFKRHSEEVEIIKKIDQYLLTCLVQFRMLFSRHLESKEYQREEIIRLLKYLLNGIMTTFTTESLAKAVSKDVLKDLTMFLLTSTHNSKLTVLEECDTIIKTLNILMLKIIQNSDHTSCFWALIKLMMDGIEQEQSQKIQDLYMKCLWKLTQLLPDIIQTLHVDAVLLDLHIFLKKYPFSYWQTKGDKMTIPTIKAFLRTLMKLVGPELLNKTVLIEDEDSSELVGILKKSFQKQTGAQQPVKTENKTSAPIKPVSMKNGNRDPMDILQDIFRKIGSKENSQEGLKELYEFKEKYPDHDVEPFIAKTSQFFRNYVERGLKTIEQERKSSSTSSKNGATKLISTGQGQNSSTINGTGAEKYLDRLKVLREKYMQINAKEPEVQEETMVKPAVPPAELPKSEEIEALSDTIKPTEKKERKEVNLDDIKRRLQQFKTGSIS